MQTNFEAWVATLDERIFDWLQRMTEDEKKFFDYSIESLDEVQKYLISKYELYDLKDERNKYAIDGAASYVYAVYMKHLPNYQCRIELKDKKNLMFNLPAINTNPRVGVDFSPYFFLPSIINLKRISDFRTDLEWMKKNYLEQYGDDV
ncbi:MAG: hypothetical protein KA010_01760 [Saprospiraceae bacterium]|nr:hypothetical protein [Saprospiraceae bacterium]